MNKRYVVFLHRALFLYRKLGSRETSYLAFNTRPGYLIPCSRKGHTSVLSTYHDPENHIEGGKGTELPIELGLAEITQRFKLLSQCDLLIAIEKLCRNKHDCVRYGSGRVFTPCLFDMYPETYISWVGDISVILGTTFPGEELNQHKRNPRQHSRSGTSFPSQDMHTRSIPRGLEVWCRT